MMLPNPGDPAAPTRDFTVATFVVRDGKVLLLWHRKLRMWLPPGGHVEPGELPDEAAVREVREETGVECALVGERGLPIERPRQLVRPVGIQLEDIAPGHQHIDLIYFARPTNPAATRAVSNEENERAGWYSAAELPALGVNEEVQAWCRRAIQELG